MQASDQEASDQEAQARKAPARKAPGQGTGQEGFAGDGPDEARNRAEAELATPWPELTADPLAPERLTRLAEDLENAGALAVAARLRAVLAVLAGADGPTARREAASARELAEADGRDETWAGVLELLLSLPVTADGPDDDPERLLSLGRRAGRVDWVARAYGAQVRDALARGEGRLLARRRDRAIARTDLRPADVALDRMTALATLIPEHPVRLEAAVLGVLVSAHRGDLEGARTRLSGLTESARPGGRADLSEGEALAYRVSLAVLFGREPAGAAPVAATPVAEIAGALAAALGGDRELAERRGRAWLEHPERVAGGPDGLGTLTLLAQLAVRLGDRAAARRLLSLLQPYAGTLPVGPGSSLPVDVLLAQLALTIRDQDAALAHARAGMDFAERFGSRPVLVWAGVALGQALRRAGEYADAAAAWSRAQSTARLVGVRLPESRIDEAPPEASLVRTGGDWEVSSPLGGGMVPSLVGMTHLARVLTAAEPLSAAELESPPSALCQGSLGRTQRAGYRERLIRLWQARESNPLFAVEEATLLVEVRRVAGLIPAEPDSPEAVLVPLRVARSLRRAIEAIEAVAPGLGEHLRESVHARAWCSYEPAPSAALTWRVEAAAPEASRRASSW